MDTPLRTTMRLIACLLLAGWTNAQSATFCVSTGIQLATALDTAATNGQDDEIRITSGTMIGTTATGNDPRWRYFPAGSDEATTVSVSGGWSTGNSCANQTIGLLLTVLDANFQGPNFAIFPLTSSYSGQISIRNLTLTRGRAFSDMGASGIQSGGTGTVSAQLLIENVLVTAAQSTAVGVYSVRIILQGGGVIRFRNNVVSSNFTTGTNSGAAVDIRATSNAIGYVSNNSIFSNQGTSQVATGLSLVGVLLASNNAVANNTTSAAATTYQVYSSSGSGITLRNNHFETVQIIGGAFSDQGTTTGNPMWSAVGAVRVPNEISPLRDSGINSPSGGIASTDIEGFPRIMNSVVDRGASEAPAVAIPDLIFRNGFEN